MIHILSARALEAPLLATRTTASFHDGKHSARSREADTVAVVKSAVRLVGTTSFEARIDGV
jgi:hypothetical protein